MGVIHIFRIYQHHKLDIIPRGHLLDDALEWLYHSGHYDYWDRCQAELSAGCIWFVVVWISKRRQGSEFSFCYGYLSHSWLIIPGLTVWAKFPYLWTEFPHIIDSGYPTTTFSVHNLHIIATATEVHVVLRPIISATSTPGISESQTQFCSMNCIAKTWFTRKLFPGTPHVE